MDFSVISIVTKQMGRTFFFSFNVSKFDFIFQRKSLFKNLFKIVNMSSTNPVFTVASELHVVYLLCCRILVMLISANTRLCVCLIALTLFFFSFRFISMNDRDTVIRLANNRDKTRIVYRLTPICGYLLITFEINVIQILITRLTLCLFVKNQFFSFIIEKCFCMRM